MHHSNLASNVSSQDKMPNIPGNQGAFEGLSNISGNVSAKNLETK
jgi:hypothetical protein